MGPGENGGGGSVRHEARCLKKSEELRRSGGLGGGGGEMESQLAGEIWNKMARESPEVWGRRGDPSYFTGQVTASFQ